jgi:hypothetical protein
MQTFTQVEGVDQPAVARLPAGGEGRIRVPDLVEAREPGIDLQEKFDVAGIGDEGRIKRARWAG